MFIFPKIHFRVERWKFNKDYGVYVSTLGNFKDRHKRNLPIRIDQNGYCRVKTEAPSNPWKSAHRLVMLTWKPIPDAENLTVDHLNHNKRDNSLYNLEWVTAEENRKRAIEDFLPAPKNSGKKQKGVSKKILNTCKVKGFEINGIIYKEEEVYDVIAQHFAPCGYPKKSVKAGLEAMKNGSNTSGMKKFGSGKPIYVRIIFEKKG